MYAASSSLAADERADMRARINDARMVSRASFLPETLLSSTSASVNAELRTMTAEAGDLGAFADASAGTRADATPEPAVAFRTKGASCSCACCVGSACELEALTAALGARSGFGSDGDAEDAVSSAETYERTTSPSAVVRSFDAGSPAACDAEACRARFAEACPKHASAGIVSARFHAESAPNADGASARGAFESFETSMVGAVFDETVFEDVYAPPSADDIRRAEEWVRDAISEARAQRTAIENTVGEVAESSGLTPEQIEESAARAEAEQAAQDAAEVRRRRNRTPRRLLKKRWRMLPRKLRRRLPKKRRRRLPRKRWRRLPRKLRRRLPKKLQRRLPKKWRRRLPRKRWRRLPRKRRRRLPKKLRRRLPKKRRRRLPRKRRRRLPKKLQQRLLKKLQRRLPRKPQRRLLKKLQAEEAPNRRVRVRLPLAFERQRRRASGWVVDGTHSARSAGTRKRPWGRKRPKTPPRATHWCGTRSGRRTTRRRAGTTTRFAPSSTI